ncbi:MAG TPA: tRNA preQ1(34) S-adenosylmethionine ribosyltransferase-isomerase QueA, partial [Methylobacterium sp.]
FARPGKRLALGDRLTFGQGASEACGLAGFDATIVGKGEGGEVTLRFDLTGPALDEAIAGQGTLPLPPYIAGKRAADSQDAVDYQTVYAREPGAVAAPTAGLHFSQDLLADIDAAGIARHSVTLHVGAGTFLPVKADDTDDHRMHAEIGRLDAATAEALNRTRAGGGRIVAVGTTALRLLESAADADGRLHPFSGPTDIFIVPGTPIRAVDALMTNFHLPRSTLFMLVAAFAGLDTMRAAYSHAIASGYRFYSYGDSSLLFPVARAAHR